jgi:hypothetical protein
MLGIAPFGVRVGPWGMNWPLMYLLCFDETSIPVDKEGSRVRNKMAFFLCAIPLALWRKVQAILMIDRSMCTDNRYYSLNYMPVVCLYVSQRCYMIDKKSVDMFGADRRIQGGVATLFTVLS